MMNYNNTHFRSDSLTFDDISFEDEAVLAKTLQENGNYVEEQMMNRLLADEIHDALDVLCRTGKISIIEFIDFTALYEMSAWPPLPGANGNNGHGKVLFLKGIAKRDSIPYYQARAKIQRVADLIRRYLGYSEDTEGLYLPKTKGCSECGGTFYRDMFRPDKSRDDGIGSVCLLCKPYTKSIPDANGDIPEGMKRCKECSEVKQLPKFTRNKNKKDGYENTCCECAAKRKREQRSMSTNHRRHI